MVKLIIFERGSNFTRFEADTNLGSIEGTVFDGGDGYILLNNTTLARPFWPDISHDPQEIINNLKSWVIWQEQLNTGRR